MSTHNILWRNKENYLRIIVRYSSLTSPLTGILAHGNIVLCNLMLLFLLLSLFSVLNQLLHERLFVSLNCNIILYV